VRRHCPAAQLCIIGDGDQLPTLSSCAPPGVRFVPSVTDPRPWYAAADVVVLPSRWEGLSLTLLEALASGCSVVASDIPGLAEAITANVGARVPAGDVGALADAVTLRLGDRDLRAVEASAARLAADAFDVRRTHEQLAAVTAQVAQRR
jgi:glycosyltransferase involved in cell wall biosynthesis